MTDLPFDPNARIKEFEATIADLRALRFQRHAEKNTRGSTALTERIARFQATIRRLRWHPRYRAANV